MPSNFTEHYQLNQWEADDIVKREDFNADNAKIDAVLAEKVNILVGTYVGDQTASRFIDLGVTPKALLLFTASGFTHGVNVAYGGLALPGYPIKTSSVIVCEIVDNGFTVYYDKDRSYANTNARFHYLAFI